MSRPDFVPGSLSGLIRFVRTHSPFYRELYRGLPQNVDALNALPIVPPPDFWAANSYHDNRLLTGPIRDGIILRSGGTTGHPKFSVFSRDEWSEFTAAFASKLAFSGLREGDRVANLFYVGELYGSFIFTHKVLEDCPLRLLQLPITGVAPLTEMIALLMEYEATVLAGLPTTLQALVEKMGRENFGRSSVRAILFAGEPMQRDQREKMLEAFPGATIGSIGYASNDAGLLGYVDASCAANEFRCYDGEAIYEIIDEASGERVTESGHEGRAVVTALKRSLMPILRYPVGDRAAWVEPEGVANRKFRLLGRAEESARIASLSLSFAEVEAVLAEFAGRLGSHQFQLVMEHRDEHDGLCLRVASRISQDQREACARDVIEALYRSQPLLRQFIEQKKVRPTRIEWRSPGELEVNSRTGKLRRIVDLRSVVASKT